MQANVNPSVKKASLLQTLKAEFRVLANFAYLAKKVFLFMF